MNREGTPLPVFRVVMNCPTAPQTQSAPASNTASGPDWTPAQQAAIHTEGGSLYVSAAAGSGKTAVLTRRIIEKIRRGGDGVIAYLRPDTCREIRRACAGDDGGGVALLPRQPPAIAVV